MMKRTILVALCLILLMPIQVDAIEQRAAVNQPILSFSGTTALCEFDITDLGKNISVTMELWNGTTLVKTWVKSGTHIVSLSESYGVVKGQTYTLKVRGTSGGVSFGPVSVTKKCP